MKKNMKNNKKYLWIPKIWSSNYPIIYDIFSLIPKLTIEIYVSLWLFSEICITSSFFAIYVSYIHFAKFGFITYRIAKSETPFFIRVHSLSPLSRCLLALIGWSIVDSMLLITISVNSCAFLACSKNDSNHSTRTRNDSRGKIVSERLIQYWLMLVWIERYQPCNIPFRNSESELLLAVSEASVDWIFIVKLKMRFHYRIYYYIVNILLIEMYCSLIGKIESEICRSSIISTCLHHINECSILNTIRICVFLT